MMKDVNKLILVGRLGADPVQKESKNGKTITQFPVATSRRVKAEGDEEGASGEETQWHRIVTWGKQAQACARFLKKGQPVYIEGSVRGRKYDNQKGEPRYSFEVHADHVVFLGKKKQEAQSA